MPVIVHAARPVLSRFVVILGGYRQDRGLRLEPLYSRAVQAGEVHELIVTSDSTAGPGATVDDIAYLGFIEIERSGVLYVGSTVSINGAEVGCLAGFDLTHAPNHLNLVIVADGARDGGDSGAQLETKVIFRPTETKSQH
jgi:hypothetical protein